MRSVDKILGMFLAIFFSYSCTSPKKNDIELVLLNNSLNVYCPNADCNIYESDYSLYKYKENIEKAKNIISFKITNNSKYTNILVPNCFSSPGEGCNFPVRSSAMGLTNFIFEKQNEQLYVNKPFLEPGLVEAQDSLILEYYKKMEYYDKEEYELLLQHSMLYNMVLIPPKSTIYFENYITLPLSFSESEFYQESVDLKFNLDYTIQMVINSDTTRIKKFLSRDVLKTIEENDFKLYHGKLISEKVPLKFIK